jgi:hypothetical protein
MNRVLIVVFSFMFLLMLLAVWESDLECYRGITHYNNQELILQQRFNQPVFPIINGTNRQIHQLQR